MIRMLTTHSTILGAGVLIAALLGAFLLSTAVARQDAGGAGAEADQRAAVPSECYEWRGGDRSSLPAPMFGWGRVVRVEHGYAPDGCPYATVLIDLKETWYEDTAGNLIRPRSPSGSIFVWPSTRTAIVAPSGARGHPHDFEVGMIVRVRLWGAFESDPGRGDLHSIVIEETADMVGHRDSMLPPGLRPGSGEPEREPSRPTDQSHLGGDTLQ
jgi:hypothetical protein